VPAASNSTSHWTRPHCTVATRVCTVASWLWQFESRRSTNSYDRSAAASSKRRCSTHNEPRTARSSHFRPETAPQVSGSQPHAVQAMQHDALHRSSTCVKVLYTLPNWFKVSPSTSIDQNCTQETAPNTGCHDIILNLASECSSTGPLPMNKLPPALCDTSDRKQLCKCLKTHFFLYLASHYILLCAPVHIL